MESKVSRRLQQATAQEVCDHIYLPRLNREFSSGFDYLSDINQAHLLMLARAGLMPRASAIGLAQALQQMERDGPAAVPLDPQREDAYFNYEAHLMRLAGADAGGRLHVARSRNDILATHDRLRARDAGLDVLDALNNVREVAISRAQQYADVVMPGYTHLQSAQPITYGHYLIAAADAIARDAARIEQALAHIDACPLGAGALAGTTFPIRREDTARLLGFGHCVANSLDAVASRDFAWELMSAMTIASLTWGRIAQDFYVWATPEFGLIHFPDRVAGTSSIMPQKKNPVVVEYLKGKTSHLIALFTASMTAVKGTHFTHSGDGNRESMRSFWESADECIRCLALFRLVLDAAEPVEHTMLRKARTDFSTATDLADALVRESGLSFREAHHAVGAVVRQALDADLAADEITAAMVNAAASQQTGRDIRLDAASVRRCLDPLASVQARSAHGGPAPVLSSQRIAELRGALEAARTQAAARRASVAAARATLKQELAALASAPPR
ncbi:argininosuccinate lyase [Achromobacter xylosoxidans]|uniref:argininosuccinate lyase n=2 Tax=Alcaligenes xylosoxydans xylosoxydans TaxID=85698 RepID=UPI00047C0F1D|nr:argininosuccinate lyase [Achromobacter xylosoxidans]MCH4592756.1 argininosuccinate lyase [Achromobacter xylosoxidans]MCM2572266.1 argininosuccinate lyase [Achromobacter xylosoxidans]MCZ8440265.1 argininosuccinate lyase [Achromobacter xylosoxidans]MDC6163243.1 argininosuccinate lyase [Achromobacter xylosoxidans]OMG77416.1 argininosuccinate lyase [Achromobacter xylosoxidans]